MKAAEILVDAFGRVREEVHAVLDGLAPGHLTVRVDDEANSIGWLVWHLTRIQDSHVADAAETDEVWTAARWSGRFALPYAASSTGYGHSSDDVAAFDVASTELLRGYYDEVHDMTVRYVEQLTDEDLDRIVDESWDPAVSLAVRLVSVISDGLQHAGQAAFVRGVLERPRSRR